MTYTPDEGFKGTDRFTYTITDGNNGTDTALVVVTVTGRNRDPIARDDQATTTEESCVIIGVLGNDDDPDGQQLSVQSVDTVGTVDKSAA